MGNNQSKPQSVTSLKPQELKILENTRYIKNKTLKPSSVKRKISLMAHNIVLKN